MILRFLALLTLLLPFTIQAQPALGSPQPARAEMERFLSKAAIIGKRQHNNFQWRISLDDGERRHDASMETEVGTARHQRHYAFNPAAYELDKALDLNMVAVSIPRDMDGRPVAVTWWVDNVAMSERDRRSKKIEPPDPERWNKQLQIARVFDELIANPYRNIHPEFPAAAGTKGNE